MAVLRALVVLALACPAVGLKGFLDSLIYGHAHQKDHAQSQNVGRTVMDAIRLAMKVGSSEHPAPRVMQVFSKYDRDGSNGLNAAESAELLKGLGFTDAETAEMQVEMDTGHDGQVTLKEFEDYIAAPSDQELQATPATTPPPVAQVAPRMPEPLTEPAAPLPVRSEPVRAEPARVESMRAEPARAPAPARAEPLPPAVVPEQHDSHPTKAPRVEPFGREDSARQLQDHASRTQDTLVDAFENAQLAEVKSTVFRALSRLRTAHIKEYDTIARLETQAIDAYNDKHTYRRENPLTHLSDYEGPVDGDKLTSFH